jgi:hypothetical protein
MQAKQAKQPNAAFAAAEERLKSLAASLKTFEQQASC